MSVAPAPARERAGSDVVRAAWPVAAGAAAGVAGLATGVSREPVTITLALATLCYLAAAAVGVRVVSWLAIPVLTGVVVGAEGLGFAWYTGVLVVAVLVAAVGLARPRTRPATVRQAAGVLAFGVLVAAALALDPRAGLVVAGLALAAHGVWDVHHLRRDAVVSRSLALACVVLDVLLGLGAVVWAATGR